VKDIIALGSHHMFIAEVLGVLADDKYIDKETGAFYLGAAGLMAYSHGAYYTLGEKLGRFGFSVMKKK
jgi:flavin reductase (DIM6/NTAB) family NADH-FMN oxidoreductase RutF